MLCEECQMNEAVFTVTLTSGDGVTRKHLCGECMKKWEANLADGDIHSFLSSILSILGSAQKTDNPVCSGCGLKYSAFEKSGRLGCAQCYHDFADKLTPMLKRIHGNTQHNGRTPRAMQPQADAAAQAAPPEAETPAPVPEISPVEKMREELRKKMDEAVACENFEDAAKYRDQLKALTEDGEVQA